MQKLLCKSVGFKVKLPFKNFFNNINVLVGNSFEESGYDMGLHAWPGTVADSGIDNGGHMASA
jgi:hypothetical protein